VLVAAATIAGVLLVRGVGSDSVDRTPGSSVTSTAGTGGAPPPSTEVGLRAGDACGWQVEGDRRTTVDGDVVCAVDGGRYRWIVAPTG